MSSDIRQVKVMLEALLKSQNHINWIGGYVYGRTSNNDPFVILYPAAPYLQEKIVRVYEHDFGKLPAFINTSDVPGDTDNNPSKEKAQKRGIYHECQSFQVVTYDGKETPMGPERRFHAVLRVSAQRAPSPAPATSQPAGNATSSPDRPEPPAEASPAENGAGDEDERDHWRVQAAMAGQTACRGQPKTQDARAGRSAAGDLLSLA